jgi:DNA polymerase-3 subunit gamma/tau
MQQSLALYRKYRPATFAEVRGQDHVTEPLRQALRSGRINHAYLFSGPRGCGKTSSARILARSLNCVNGPTPDPCGVCDSCIALAPSGPGSIDVIEIDAASHGGVDDARDLRERAFYAPVAGRYKIYIIDEAHMVTQQGFNALLKLVEEPPAHLKFIFATTEPDKVIATIRSRTHHYPFRLMPPSVMRELTEEILHSEGVTFDPAVLPLVVRAGAGSARDTLSILDQLLAGSDEAGIRYDRAVALLGYTDASLLDEIVDAFAASDGAGVFRAVNRVIEGGHEPRRFGTDMLDRFRDLIVLASVPDAITTGLLDVPPDRAAALQGQAERYGLASLTRAAEIVSAGLDQMRGATSPRLLLELMCAQVLLPGAATDERSVLSRLERLEAGAVPVRAAVPRENAKSDHQERTGPTVSPHASAPPGTRQGGAGPVPSPQTATAAPPVPAPPAAQSPGPQSPAAQAPQGQASPAASAPREAQQAPAVQPAPPVQPAPALAVPAGTPAFAAAGTAATPPAPGGSLTTEILSQAWPSVLEAVKAKGRVAAIVIGNASVVSLNEAVLTLRFPRQGDVKGFTGTRYEDLLKQVLNGMFGRNFVVRAITGNDASPPAGRPGTGPVQPAAPAPFAAAPPRDPDPTPVPAPNAEPAGNTGPTANAVSAGDRAAPSAQVPPRPAAQEPVSPPVGSTGNGSGGATGPFGTSDLLPPPPDDDYFDPDDEDNMAASSVSELTGMALVQRDLGGQIIGE